MFFVHKSSRMPDYQNGSYSGPSWDAAQIRHLFKPFYETEVQAKLIAEKLTVVNSGCPFVVCKKD